MIAVVVTMVLVIMIVSVMAVAVVVAGARSRPGCRTILIVPVFVRLLVRLVADDVADTSTDAGAYRRTFAAVPGLMADDRAENRTGSNSERGPRLRVTTSAQERGASQQTPHQDQATGARWSHS